MRKKPNAASYFSGVYSGPQPIENILDPHLHGWFAAFLQRTPPYRKMALMPRGHLKSTCVSECLPMHPPPTRRAQRLLAGAGWHCEMLHPLIGEKQELMSPTCAGSKRSSPTTSWSAPSGRTGSGRTRNVTPKPGMPLKCSFPRCHERLCRSFNPSYRWSVARSLAHIQTSSSKTTLSPLKRLTPRRYANRY